MPCASLIQNRILILRICQQWSEHMPIHRTSPTSDPQIHRSSPSNRDKSSPAHRWALLRRNSRGTWEVSLDVSEISPIFGSMIVVPLLVGWWFQLDKTYQLLRLVMKESQICLFDLDHDELETRKEFVALQGIFWRWCWRDSQNMYKDLKQSTLVLISWRNDPIWLIPYVSE